MFRLTAAAASHVGCVRQANEDSLFADPRQAIWAVADGMGGLARGDWASAWIIAELAGIACGRDLDANADAIEAALHRANAVIHAAAHDAEGPIGSTVVVFAVVDDRFACLWSGDSRLYRIDAMGGIAQISRDHSEVEALVTAGVIRRADARLHPLSNILTRAIGVEPVPRIDRVIGQIEDNDRFLLCSDGLNRCLADEEIAAIAAAAPLGAACPALIGASLTRGAPDNVTVALIAAERATLARGWHRPR